jgi:hypothetical protein
MLIITKNIAILKSPPPPFNKGGQGGICVSNLGLLIPFFIVLIIFVGYVYAEDIALSEEAQKCLGCHGKHGIVKRFENNESVPAYVDIEKFKASVHNFLTCSDCHTDFSMEKHPERRFRSKEQYKIKSSQVCKQCHTDKQIKDKSIHAKLLSEEIEGKSHPCTNCHGAHSTMRRVGKKILTNEEQYCLSCHGYELSMEFKDGERLSLKINASLLRASVHNKLSCSDCHFGFSKSQHPQRIFKSIRDFSIATSEVCRRCHFDKYAKSLESIHYAMLSQGDLKAPVCTDCHGSHSIQAGRVEKELIGRRCQKCHEKIFDIYASSVHGKALFNRHIRDVPICIDCHMSHNIADPRTTDYREKVPEICGSCHANKEIMGKYGLSTDVVKTYLSDFHGVTLSFYRKQKEELNKPTKPIAVCTDCHGTHNIISTRATDPAIVKANLVKRCQQCHKGATEDFPDTWLSHYEPSLKKAPLVFIVGQIYKVFIPIMLIGLILQILLHIWRYAVNR